jgi:hypothetical protein
MNEYLAPGVARRTFTDANLTAINTDADRFMKVGRSTPGSGSVATGQAIAVVPGAIGSRNGLLGDAGRVSAWASALLDPPSMPVGLPGFVAGGLRADMPAQGGSDTLTGGAGDDLQVGGAGQDLLVGGFVASAPVSAVRESGDGMREVIGTIAIASDSQASTVDHYFLLHGDGTAQASYDLAGSDTAFSQSGDVGDAS